MDEERWKNITGFNDYQVSSLGRVKSLKHGKERLLKPRKNSEGYFSIVTCNNGKEVSHRIHRLVALEFIPNPDNLPQVDHIDRNISNNQLNNLRWVSQSQNSFNTHRHYKESYGIYWKKQFNFYQIIVTYEGKLKSLGCTPDFEKAKEIRDRFLHEKKYETRGLNNNSVIQ